MEYSSELEKAEEIRKEQERPKTFREVGNSGFRSIVQKECHMHQKKADCIL